MNEEKRIYVVVTKYAGGQRIPCGMAAAQAAHVVAMLRGKQGVDWKPITTIILSCRDQDQLNLVWQALGEESHLFYDTNEEFYGHSNPEPTAIAVGPISQERIESELKFLGIRLLPLWSCRCDR